jgi:aspartyl-tRNA(Asn)/glutamyl-tRNA(Gln) amidotransferase subunit A
MDDRITTLSATETLAAFQSRELSPVEHVRAHLDRIERVNPTVNAIGDVYAEEALAAAAGAARAYSPGQSPRPLEGLLVAVKDEAEMAGKRTTNGSLLWQDWIGHADEPMIERIAAAGAVVHARTLTPEFSIAFWTSSRLWGTTHNPWNTAYDVGGSSGGSAAALAAGLTPLATGSDIGGSIRVPASCCGVVGYKPAYGRIPQLPPYGLDTWCHLGPLARTVADAALLADAVSGPDARDHASLRPALRLGTPQPGAGDLRIAWSDDLEDWPVTEPVRAAVACAAAALADAGAAVERVRLPLERRLVARAADAHYAAGFAADVAATIAGHEDEVCDYTSWWVRSLAGSPDAREGIEAEAEIQRRIGAVLDRFDALLCPTMSIAALHAGVDYTTAPLTIAGATLDAFRDVCLTEVFNAASRCPVVTVPVGRDPDGVPIGVQVAGRTYDDVTAFRIAATLERQLPWPLLAPV